ncbi:hypothetical protein FZEAL_8641 [Fusarium zealandicum]|uniref:NACHT domain-containing protein n=1 Tax=Fusarium zealandicum TaxID=1053134 RepID=A0A8H4XGN9_9HYPO|nr:hypothetical protein FZEAL_8641 [Fusarium zealandicum]
MATGLEALGAASAVLQVISFASEVVCGCKKIYDGKPTGMNDLEEHTKRMSDAIGRIQSRCQTMAKTQPSEHEKKLSDIAKDCRAAAKELETEVRFVTAMHRKGSLLKAANAFLRASRHRKKIERLELQLFRYRQVMETELMSHLCSRGDALQLQQRQDFNHLEEDVQHLVTRISEGHTKLENLMGAEHSMTREVIVQETARTKEHITTKFEALGIDAATEAQRNSFLQSLKFPEINQRYNDLMSSEEATFQRVFRSYTGMTDYDSEESDADKREQNEIDQVWAEFIAWLQSSDSLFCVRGKPGSGKSTLVKFIIDNENTKQLLRFWSPDATIISHFFWKIGSSPQNSVKGFLCSLIYRSLEDNEELVKHILDHFPRLTSKSNYNDWSTEDLRSVLYAILQKDTQHLCIFIDGLDEICNKDGLSKLTQTIEGILKFPNIKLCVASRPETLVMGWLKKKGVSGVLLEDLTRPDMRTFVHKELEPFLSSSSISAETYQTLIQELVWKAQGVFLWLYLATRSVSIGVQNEDPEELLLARLQGLPSELEQLYSDMWQRLNENNSIYRATAARYFRYALAKLNSIGVIFQDEYLVSTYRVPYPGLLHVACAENVEMQEIILAGLDTIDHVEVQRLCEKTELAIQNRCAGLLRVTRMGSGGYEMEDSEHAKYINFPKDAFNSSVEFIHRTAHDFLIDTEAGQEILQCEVLSETEVKVRLLKGVICLVRFLDSKYGTVMDADFIIVEMIVGLSESRGNAGLQEAIKILHIVHKLCDNKAIGRINHPWMPGVLFLGYLISHTQFDDFVISSVAQAATREILATDVLREAWGLDLCWEGSRRPPSARLVKALISIGADLHAHGISWKRMYPFVWQSTAFADLLVFAMQMLNTGESLSSMRESLDLAESMAMTCPDLSATILLIGCIGPDGNMKLQNLTHLGGYTMHHSFQGKQFALLYEVDFRFLLLRLLSGRTVDTSDNALDHSRIHELLPRLENPSAKIRLIIKPGEEREPPICHHVPSQLSVPEITDLLFTPGAYTEPRRAETLETDEIAYETIVRLVKDPSTQEVDLESAVLSLAHEGLGFCTLEEAGIVPSLSYMEWEGATCYPSTTEQLKAAASRAANDVRSQATDQG